MRKRIDLIVFLCAVGLAILSACLIAVWRPFALFTGVFMLIASGVSTYWRYEKYKNFSRALSDQRYEDAFVYADENNTNFDPDNFAYSKKEERKLGATARNLKTMIFVGVVLCLASILLIIFSFKLL